MEEHCHWRSSSSHLPYSVWKTFGSMRCMLHKFNDGLDIIIHSFRTCYSINFIIIMKFSSTTQINRIKLNSINRPLDVYWWKSKSWLWLIFQFLFPSRFRNASHHKWVLTFMFNIRNYLSTSKQNTQATEEIDGSQILDSKCHQMPSVA